MNKLFIVLLVTIAILGLSGSVSAKKIYHKVYTPTPTPSITATPTPHTHLCEDEDGTYLADNSVECMHKCTLSDGSSYFAAAGLSCVGDGPTPYLGKMPKQHTHVCTLSDGTTYEADNSVDCPAT